MKKSFALLLAGMIMFVFSVSAHAVGPGKKVEFDGKGAGKVVFDGKAHSAAKCGECHKNGIPYKAPGAEGALKITMADINAGKVCGLCHNGAKAFDAKDKANCSKCHKKK